MAHLLIVTLGPIQDFIAAARRTRDLWFGSWLLSELSKATAQAMARECGLDALVFPGVFKSGELGPETETSVANKIVVRVPNGKDPAAVARRGEEGMRERLKVVRGEAFERIRPLDPLHFDRPTAEAQVEDLIEFAWVSAPEHGDGYADARSRAETLLAARKNTRLWGQVSWGAQVPKSSIDGERESVLHEALFDSVGKNGGPAPEEVRRRYGVGPTERLCGVGLLKRHGTHSSKKYAHRFLSTGHLAAWPLYQRTKEKPDEELREAWKKYLLELGEGGVILKEQEIYQAGGWTHPVLGDYDGSLLFENRLPELFEDVIDTERRTEGLRKAKAALAGFLSKLGVQTPLPYYAILVADGDHMGKAIERQKGFKDHQRLSTCLAEFAKSVRSTVESGYAGELVYSGGDDVLAFVPLHHAVACARKLAEDFKERLSGFPANEEGQTPTLSAGIGVSYFLEPLRRALHLARKAEELAKERRNSLAIIVDKRSGPPVKVSGVWGTLDKRLEDYVWLHREDKVPDGAAYELEELARLLEGAKGEEKENLEKLVRKEAERILRRKQPGQGEEKGIDAKVLGRLFKDLDETLIAAPGEQEDSTLKAAPGKHKDSTLSKVANRLIVARLFAQAAEQAGEKSIPPEAALMNVWLIEPLDPLIARDGRPAAVGRFDTVDFPYPSMLAGAVRTRMGSQNGAFSLPGSALAELKEKVIVEGPLLAELEANGGEIREWFAPAPRDAVFLLGEGDRVALKRLIPRPLSGGEAMDSLGNGLVPLGFQGGETYGKPPKGIPSFWKWSAFETWLTAPEDRSEVDFLSLGIDRLPVEKRAHLAIQPGERVGIDGMLFQTAGLRFLQEGDSRLSPRRFAMSLRCKGASVAGRDLSLETQIAPLGGERRLARWSPASAQWPQMPEAIREKIVASRRARLILLTPAIFGNGARPGWSGERWPQDNSVKVTVSAACVPRYAVVSGWDLAAENDPGKPKGRPKRTRRLAAAGSVYFLELEGTKEDLLRWCDETWFACVSDDVQDRRDGFGLAVLGTWEEAR